jgi:hypothetical protein
MPEYTGGSLFASFINPGGTLVLSTDYRTITSAPTIALVKSTAGSDADETYLVTQKDGKYSWKGVAQTSGTVLENQLLEGTQGTLIIGREGTVAGKVKETVPVIAMGADFNYPYDGIVEVSCDFQKNGARVLSVYP